MPGDLSAAASCLDRLQQTTGSGGGEQHLGKGRLPVELLGDRGQTVGRVQPTIVVCDPIEEVAEKGIEWGRDVWGGGSSVAGVSRFAHGAEW